jgi:uncharacterized protein (TIGR02145 family)
MKNFYITLFLLLPSIGYSQFPCPGLDSINYSSQWYHTVQIGSQCWLQENLNIGKIIPAVTNQINNDTIEKFCYNNDPANCTTYGGLYQWREAIQYSLKPKGKGICPLGWHIPTVLEFDTLISTIHGDGNALKEVGQGEGTNTSGFSAILGGHFASFTSDFMDMYNTVHFWSSTKGQFSVANDGGFVIYADNFKLFTYSEILDDKNFTTGNCALSIRCIKDDIDLLLQSPYGGENYQIGSNHKITWGGNNLTDTRIKIEYSTDNGTNWIEITSSTPAIDGAYNWTIPNTASKNCKVRITDINNVTSSSISDAVFTIFKNPCPGSSNIEHGGQTYNTVVIRNQCWFKENLNIGTMIPGLQESANNGFLEKYCYNDDTANCSKYGGLYQFSETRETGLCPVYWHVEQIPVDAVLYDGDALKEIGQGSGFGAGTNTSGFSALLSGRRWTDGTFISMGSVAWFPYRWELPFTLANFLGNNFNNINYTDQFSNCGGSIRCVRDDVGPLLLKSPAGGENYQIGTTQKISWTLSEVINIKIDYSTNNGTSWINITPSFPTSQGSYNWTIPITPSTNCKVRISSTDHSDTNSVSNIFQIYQVPTNPCPGIPTVNYAGQTYNTIAIGDQCWMRENVNIGTMINVNVDQSNNGIVEKYCYNNDTNNCSIYGGLYQWNEAMQYSTIEKAKGICPIGWHVPSWNEFMSIYTFVSGNGNELKEVGQGTGTNSSGFSALLAGLRNANGTFSLLTTAAFYWSSKGYDATRSYYFELNGSDGTIVGGPINNNVGGSIRCINDSSVSALPVELTTFNASINNSDVILIWKTATEINSSLFELERRIVNANTWQKITSVLASGNSNLPNQYTYIDKNVNVGKYYYRLKMIDLDGSSKYSNILNIEVAPPAKFELSNAYPNPWNPTTTIRYQVPVNILVTIKVFDALGREVSTLVNEVKPAGRYEITLSAKGFASGIYYYQMKAGLFIQSKKIILMK